MRSFLAALILVGLVAPVQTAEKMSPMKALAYNNFHQEMVDCVAYYSIAADALRKRGEVDTVRKYKTSINGLLRRIFVVAGEIGMKNEAAQARIRMTMAEQLKSINNDLINISILLEKYAYLCKDVIENPEARFLHWLKEADKRF